jgi:hypothetical protein
MPSTDRIHATPRRMNLAWRTVNAIQHGSSLALGTVNAIHGSDSRDVASHEFAWRTMNAIGCRFRLMRLQPNGYGEDVEAAALPLQRDRSRFNEYPGRRSDTPERLPIASRRRERRRKRFPGLWDWPIERHQRSSPLVRSNAQRFFSSLPTIAVEPLTSGRDVVHPRGVSCFYRTLRSPHPVR